MQSVYILATTQIGVSVNALAPKTPSTTGSSRRTRVLGIVNKGSINERCALCHAGTLCHAAEGTSWGVCIYSHRGGTPTLGEPTGRTPRLSKMVHVITQPKMHAKYMKASLIRHS